MTIIKAHNLTLKEVHYYLKFQKLPYCSFESFLQLEPLSEVDKSEIAQISIDFDNYLLEGEVKESMVMALSIFPLLRLAGFYRSPIQMRIEEEIERIYVEDEEVEITGRMDLICLNKETKKLSETGFYILVIEAKNSKLNASDGLPQLLTYAHKSLTQQNSVWGLTTNGLYYEFFYIQQNGHPTYQPLPSLHLLETNASETLLQVLKAICQGQNE
ncbi:MAG: restriction endonuclease subunit R [Microcystaceae cyanobacterium]